MSIAEKYVKSSDFPKAFLQKLGFEEPLNQYFKIIPVSQEEIDFDIDGTPMPLEENFKENFLSEIKASRKSYEKGDFVHCETQEESDKLLLSTL